MIRFLIAPLMLTIVAGGELLAQSAFPAPLPGQVGQPQPPANGSAPPAAAVTPPVTPFPSTGAPPIGAIGSAPQSEAFTGCMNDYIPLREDVERKGKLITAARERSAPPGEACKLIDSFRAAEAKLIRYVETSTARCGIPARIANELNANCKRTTGLLTRVCTLAQQQMRKREPAGPTGDFWPTTTDAPI
jgi:hypothetical protein